MSRIQSTFLAAMLLAGASAGAATNLVQNNDFETPVSLTVSCYQNATAASWSTFGSLGNHGSCITPGGYTDGTLTWPVGHTGNQMMWINYLEDVGTGVSQSVFLVANTAYQLTFSLAGVIGEPIAPAVNVSLGNGVGSRSFSSSANTTWSNFTWNFTPSTTGSTPLSFVATAGAVNIDSVVLQVSAVPELATSSMFAAGLLVLGGIALRRRQSAGV